MAQYKTKKELFDEIIEYLYTQHTKIDKQQNEIREKDKEYLNNSRYGFNYGRISMLAEIYALLEELKKKY